MLVPGFINTRINGERLELGWALQDLNLRPIDYALGCYLLSSMGYRHLFHAALSIRFD